MIMNDAVESDLSELVALSKIKRDIYAKYQPQFWNPSDNADETQIKFFKLLFGKSDCKIAVLKSSSGEKNGANLFNIVSGHQDKNKSEFLISAGLSAASIWFVGGILKNETKTHHV